MTASRSARSAQLPVFPWDTLADATATARAHPDGIVDLDASPAENLRALIPGPQAAGAAMLVVGVGTAALPAAN